MMLTFDQLEEVLDDKGATMTRQRLEAVIADLLKASQIGDVAEFRLQRKCSGDGINTIEAIELDLFVDLLLNADLSTRIEERHVADANQIRQLLLTQDLEEVIAKITRLKAKEIAAMEEMTGYEGRLSQMAL